MENQNLKKENFVHKISINKNKRLFQLIWTEKYGVVEKNSKALCILCGEYLTIKTSNIDRHFKAIHKDLLLKSDEERKLYILLRLENYEKEDGTLLKFMKSSTDQTMVSYMIAFFIALRGKPLSDGEYIKEIFLNCAPKLFNGLPNYEQILKRISDLQISRNTIKARIMDLSKNVHQTMTRDLASCKFFSISLDETTDITSRARLAIIARYFDGAIIREELVKLETLPVSTTGKEIFKAVKNIFESLEIDITKIVSITTDSASNMVGKQTGFKKLFTDLIGHPVVPFHCIIHQEVLCAKYGFLEFNEMMSVVTKTVNFISSRPLNKREFSALLSEVESSYNGLLMFNNVRWLSRGKVLERFVDCIEEITVFATLKGLEILPKLTCHVWKTNLMFFTDLSVHLNQRFSNFLASWTPCDVLLCFIDPLPCFFVFRRPPSNLIDRKNIQFTIVDPLFFMESKFFFRDVDPLPAFMDPWGSI
jgi:hypothetical protein